MLTFKTLMCLCCIGLMSQAIAVTHEQSKNYPGVCDIEIINESSENIKVYGRFDDGSYLTPFIMEYLSEPRYVSLFYYGMCHHGMDFYIETIQGQYKYNGFTPVDKVIRIR